jgi:hypothetical protein
MGMTQQTHQDAKAGDGAVRPDEITVKVATTEAAIREGLEFCAQKYAGAYKSSWAESAQPDVLFIACVNGEIVGTAALELGSRRDRIDTERYFRLTPRMRKFIDQKRDAVAEVGRFSSDDIAATRAVLHAAITYCQQVDVDFLFGWANPGVYAYVESEVGVPHWLIDVPVNKEAVETDTEWVEPPVEFFIRDDPPKLLLAVVPFLDLVNDRLSEQYGGPLTLMT